MITLKEIAEKSNVSIATVSNTLNGKSNVSEETKERILKIVKENGYRPNYMARGLRASSTKTIGILIDDITEFNAPQIINGIMTELEKKGYRALLENLRFYSKWGKGWETSETYREAIYSATEEFKSIKADGIIYVAAHARDISVFADSLSIPLTICYAFTHKNGIPYVMIDDETSAFNMTEYLISKGNSKIAVITGAEDNIHTINRLTGYKKALERHGISYEPSLVGTGNWREDSGYECCKSLMESQNDFSALFCFNDLMAAGAYKYLYEAGKTPGKDISVTGFDNREISAFLNPPLTTMEIPLFSVGEEAARTILSLIKSRSDGTNTFIPCTLIDRESVVKNI